MAKKVVATLKTGKGVSITKLVQMHRSPKTGAYSFKEELMLSEKVQDAIKK
jgi:hypothetical protein